MKQLDERSRKRLTGVHPDLVKVVTEALQNCTVNFLVTEGLRTLERQKQLLAAGASTTLRSRHLTGHAIDVAAFIDLDGDNSKDPNEEIRWDWPLYYPIAESFRVAGEKLNIPVEWGGHWRLLNGGGPVKEGDLAKFADGPHFQLSWDKYPA